MTKEQMYNAKKVLKELLNENQDIYINRDGKYTIEEEDRALERTFQIAGVISLLEVLISK